MGRASHANIVSVTLEVAARPASVASEQERIPEVEPAEVFVGLVGSAVMWDVKLRRGLLQSISWLLVTSVCQTYF